MRITFSELQFNFKIRLDRLLNDTVPVGNKDKKVALLNSPRLYILKENKTPPLSGTPRYMALNCCSATY